MTITDQDIPVDPAELQRLAVQMLTGLTELEDKHASLEAHHKAETQNRDMMIEKWRHQLFGLRKDKFGSSSEGLDQLGLRLEDEETGQGLNSTTTKSDDADEVFPKVKPVRRALPKKPTQNICKAYAGCALCGLRRLY